MLLATPKTSPTVRSGPYSFLLKLWENSQGQQGSFQKIPGFCGEAFFRAFHDAQEPVNELQL